ncbi:aldehyde dehydrogenase [Microdochium trichocladiopsis]|uniref:Aldehyde dehydrogenase n=1 Tax=Microdochium trichocladiopsis TaxID=1682393 RepID=A0A9P8Y3X0_9PEZI|nr:aldehyde dehydrogenase [Microdochium trichocladiopsis]KAH7028895.1 aldehyde dehydrogenase [Microdochium trichocladiopsis]
MGSLNTNSTAAYTVPLVINNEEVRTTTTFPVISPLDGREIWTCSSASTQDALSAVAAAQAAFPAWSRTKPSERRDLFLRAADIIERRKEELGHYMHLEVGADKAYQEFILGLSIEGLRDTAGRIAGAVQGSVPESNHAGMKAIIYKKPYGVVLGIAPWNAPYHLGLRSVTFALAAGNTTILKGPEFSPRCYWAIVDVFREAGLPTGCLNLILHRPADAAAVTEALIAAPEVKKTNFTGSSAVGSIIASLSGKYLKPSLMELGGKASAIVMADADLSKASMHCAMGAFMNAGQICMSTERIIVHSSVADSFRQNLSDQVSRIFGTAETIPVIITAASARRNRELIKDAVSQGAEIIGHVSSPNKQHWPETKMRPTIVTGLDPRMKLYLTESFGPSVSLFAYETEEDAVALANNTDYGLSAAVFSENLGAAFRIADKLESGAVHINSMTVHDEFALPHGGVKSSGFGRFNGYQGLEEFLYCKTVTWME